MLSFKVSTCEELDYLRVVPDPGFDPVRADLAILDSVFLHCGKRPEDVHTRSPSYVRCGGNWQLATDDRVGCCVSSEGVVEITY